MILRYSEKHKLFVVVCDHEELHKPRDAGFGWREPPGVWATASPYTAYTLRAYADETVRAKLAPIQAMIESSAASESALTLPAPPGLVYLPYQDAGVIGAAGRFDMGRKAVLLADEMGLGKTIQAVGVAQRLGIPPDKMLVVCPAGLRLNWKRELDRWQMTGPPAHAVLSGADREPSPGTLILSYDMAARPDWLEPLLWERWELLVVDEAHYLKNPEAKRTKAILGRLVDRARRVLLLTGTPAPNRPHELYPVLRRLAPDVIDRMTYIQFLRRYTTGYQGTYGWEITGGKNLVELGNRLRGSGFMIRRLVGDVQPQLPKVRYSMIIFPRDSTTAKIVEKESQFDPKEIVRHGVPVRQSALPELRHEMGLAKAGTCASWISDALEDGGKIVVCAHHRDVIARLANMLQRFAPAVVHGGVAPAAREAEIHRFQTDEACRVFIGQEQTLVGVTLTASHVVVFVESSWVPEDDAQVIGRVRRIGQLAGGIMVYYLVVEESLDAKILGDSAFKRQDIETVMNGGK